MTKHQASSIEHQAPSIMLEAEKQLNAANNYETHSLDKPTSMQSLSRGFQGQQLHPQSALTSCHRSIEVGGRGGSL